MTDLDQLESQSVYILREAFNKIDRLALLWSIGKDSNVLLWLVRKAFFGDYRTSVALAADHRMVAHTGFLLTARRTAHGATALTRVTRPAPGSRGSCRRCWPCRPPRP